jgi:predicted ester cyclase
MRATHRGEFFGIPPTGKQVTVTGIHVLRIADGKIAEHCGATTMISA